MDILSADYNGNTINPPGKSYTDFVTTEKDLTYVPDRIRKSVSNQAADTLNRETGIGYELNPLGEYNKYTRLGLSENVQLLKAQEEGKLDQILAESQSNWSKATNALAQTIVSEIGLGTAQAFSDIFDAAFLQWFDKDNDYTNPVSAKIQEWRNKFDEEVAPVYSDSSKTILNGGLADFGWWAKNMPSIMSSLTLLVPGTAGAKLLGAAAKSKQLGKILTLGAKEKSLSQMARGAVRTLSRADKANAFDDLNAVQRFVNSGDVISKTNAGIEMFTNAAIMRTAENYQEARGTYVDTYAEASKTLKEMKDADYAAYIARHPEFQEEGVDVNNKDAVAKHIANKAANTTFVGDAANVLFDVIQLYSLKNIGKALGFNKAVKSGAAQAAQKESIAGLTATTEQQVEKAASKTALSEFWDYTKNNYKPWIKSGAGEATEGIEEAINYIAQEEGLTYGKVLLGKEKPTSFDSRFKDYLKSPQMYDSAFWGWMGGIVFGAGGGAYNKFEVARKRQKALKEREVNKETGEGRSVEGSFISLLETPENDAAVTAIKSRNIKLNQLKEDLDTVVNKKINIFGKADEKTGLKPKFEGDVEAQVEMATAKLIQNYRVGLTMDAISSGTYDMLKEYVQDPAMKQAMVDKGIVESDKADQFIQDTIADMEKTKETYYQQITQVKHQADFLNTRKNATPVPLDYVQLIAKENTEHLLNIDELDRRINATDSLQAARQAAINHGNDEGAINANAVKETIELGRIAYQYAEYDKQLKALDKTDYSPLQKEIIRKEIINRKEAIAKYLSRNNNPANLLFALRLTESKDSRRTDEELIEEYEKYTKENNRGNRTDLTFRISKQTLDAISATADKLAKDYIDYSAGKNGLMNSSQQLFSLYTDIADLETEKAIEVSKIATTADAIAERVDFFNTQNTAVRYKMVEAASDIITTLYKNHKDNFGIIEEAITLAYNGRKEDAEKLANSALSSEEAADLMSAIKVFNFTQSSNDYIFKYITAMTEGFKEHDRTVTENNLTNQNPISEPQNSELNNVSSEQSETTTPQENEEILPIPPENEQPNEIKVNLNISQDNGVEIIEDTNGNIPLTINDSGTGVLALDSMPKEDVLNAVGSDLLIDPDFDLLDENNDWEVTVNPTFVKEDGKWILRRRGELGLINAQDSSTGEVIDEGQSSEPIVEPTEASAEEPTPEPVNPENIVNLTPTAEEIINDEANAELDNFILYGMGNAIDVLGKDLDLEYVRGKILDKLDPKFDRNAASILIDYYYDELTSAFDETDGLNELESAAVGVTMAAKFVDSNNLDNIDSYSNLFRSSFDGFIEAYTKTLLTPTINVDGKDKQYIKLSDLMNLCEQLAAPMFNTDSQSLFNVFKGYLTNEANQDKYFIVDIKDVNNGTYKTNEEFRTEQTRTFGSYRLDISASDIKDDQTVRDTINSLTPGSKLSITIDEKSRTPKLIVKDENGVVVGKLTAPWITQEGHLSRNAGWVENLAYTNNTVSGRLKDIVTYIFTSENDDAKEVRNILIQCQQHPEEINLHTDAFAKLEYIDQLVEQSKAEPNYSNRILYVDKEGSVSYDRLLIYLSNIWNGIGGMSATSKEARLDNIKSSINNWFENLYFNLAAARATYDHIKDSGTSFESTVQFVTNGETVKAVDALVEKDEEGNVTKQNYDKLSSVKEGIADKYLSTGKAHLAVVDPASFGDVHQSNGEIIRNTNNKSGSTFMIIDGPGGPEFIRAAGSSTSELNTNTTEGVGKMMDCMMKNLGSAIRSYSINPSTGVPKLMNIIYELFGQTNGTKIGLVEHNRGKVHVKELVDKQGFKKVVIFYKNRQGGTNKLEIYTGGKYNNSIVGFRSDDPEIEGIEGNFIASRWTGKNYWDNAGKLFKAIKHIAMDDASFNISMNGVVGDNKTTIDEYEIPDSSNYLRYETIDGKRKFIVDIPSNLPANATEEQLRSPMYHFGYRKEYDSYQDFMVSEGLVKVNTKVENGDNFRTKGISQLNNKLVNISLINGTTSPVEESGTSSQTPEIHILPKSDPVEFDIYKRIFDINSGHKGVQIAEKLFSAEALADAEFKALLSEFLPSTIIYDEDFNDIKQTDDGVVEIGDVAQTAPNGRARYRRLRKQIGFDEDGKPKYRTRVLRQHSVVVGDRFLNLLAGNQRSKREALAKLIHEKLHDTINNNVDFTAEQIYEAVKPIYNEFVKAVEKEIKDNPTNPTLPYVKAWYDQYVSKARNKGGANIYDASQQMGNIRLEEFIVESLTSQSFIDFLNNVETTETTEEKKSIFDKFLEFIMKYIFNRDGFTLNNKGLLKKELTTLTNAMNSIESTTPTSTDLNDTLNKEPETKPKVKTPEGTPKPTTVISKGKLAGLNLRGKLRRAGIVDTYSPDVMSTPSSRTTTEIKDRPLDSKEVFEQGLSIDDKIKFNNLLDNGIISYMC